jgi:type II secretory pathway predicted ATPase ExeA
MALEETASYLKQHLKPAGRTDTLFSDDAITLIHRTSHGYRASRSHPQHRWLSMG